MASSLARKLAAVLLASLPCLAAAGCGEPPDAGPDPQVPPHHGAGGRFRNPHLSGDRRGWGFFRWQLGLGPEEQPAVPPNKVPPYRPEVAAPDLNRIHHPDPAAIQVTWIGHDTFLIQAAGLNILTDPIFSDRASPFPFIGPRRLAPPGIPLAQLPPVQAVIISHNHYDHLDLPTVRRLGRPPRFFVPLGLGAWFRETGVSNLIELDWWQSAALGPVRLVSVPAQHFSMRTPFDRDRSLWCGWVLETPAGNIFFAGCTGYSPDFKEIGGRFGPMRLALLPIGSYRPRWFMRPMHVDPPEAVSIHRDLRARQSIGMHWGTFHLTDEPMGEPPVYLKQALAQAGVPPQEFVTLMIGETLVLR